VDNNVSRNYYFHSLSFNNKIILLIHNKNGLSPIAFANIIQIIIIHSTVAVGVPIHDNEIYAQHENTFNVLVLTRLYQTSSRIHRSDFY
jgi:hypothetical protein